MSSLIVMTRRENLQRIADQIGGRKALSAKTGKTLSHICGMLNGDKSFGSAVARDIESALGLEPLSLDRSASAASNGALDVRTSEDGYVRITALEVRKEYKLAHIRELSKIRLMECKEDWLYEQAVATSQPKALRLLSAPSDNMEPEILQGGVVVVDISQDSFTANGIYVIAYQGLPFIYRIQINPDGTTLFLSDNKKYEKMVVKDLSNIVVIGRCVGCSNTHSL